MTGLWLDFLIERRHDDGAPDVECDTRFEMELFAQRWNIGKMVGKILEGEIFMQEAEVEEEEAMNLVVLCTDEFEPRDIRFGFDKIQAIQDAIHLLRDEDEVWGENIVAVDSFAEAEGRLLVGLLQERLEEELGCLAQHATTREGVDLVGALGIKDFYVGHLLNDLSKEDKRLLGLGIQLNGDVAEERGEWEL